MHFWGLEGTLRFRCFWKQKKLEKGAAFHSDYVIFDPLPEGAFGANIHLSTANRFDLEYIRPALHRRAVSCHGPLLCRDRLRFRKIYRRARLGGARVRAVKIEVCEVDEIFYSITLIPTQYKVQPDIWLTIHGRDRKRDAGGRHF